MTRFRQDICGPCSCNGESPERPYKKAVLWHDEPYCLDCAERHLHDMIEDKDELNRQIRILTSMISDHRAASEGGGTVTNRKEQGA